MKRQEAIEEIRSNWKRLYPVDRKKKGIVCPLCGSGSGTNGTGITGDSNHGKPNSLKCWSCGFSGDVIDLMQQDTGADFNTAISAAAEKLGITIDAYTREEVRATQTVQSSKKEPGPQDLAEDYTEYYKKCAENITDLRAISYLSARGITLGTALMYGLGFDAEWVSPTVLRAQKAKGNTWSPEPTERIILPVTSNHYIARSINESTPKQYAKMNETGNGRTGIFNAAAIYENSHVFVVEGFFDAMSIIEAGANAIALNSTSNVNMLLDMLKEKPTTATVILCLDADEAGERAQKALKEGLKMLHVRFTTADVTNGKKDPNEALTSDKEAFMAAVREAVEQTKERPDSIAAYMEAQFANEINDFNAAANIKTGFANLDDKIGNLYPGLYVLAAISSLGKTTFAHQIADNIAASDTEVLYFSLEQSRLELVSKSISRKVAQSNINTTTTSLSIRKGERTPAIEKALKEYKAQIGGKMSVVEGNFNCNISFIREYVERYIDVNQTKPVIFIDYLQILQPETDGKRQQNTKETIDNTVTELKRMSRDLNLVIIAISSVNRANYLTPIDFESLKESGGIEYTADVVWGLQLQCLSEPLFDKEKSVKEKRERVKEAKAELPRKIELICLKNRYGISSYSCKFSYYPQHDLFVPEVSIFDCLDKEKVTKPNKRY